MDKVLKNGELFGTDGIRGTPGEYPLTQGMISKIGYSVARFIAYRKGEFKGKVVIGKDTRLSGDWIETIFVDSLTSYGIDVFLTGTITTPGLAFFTRELKADLGVMISASHNKATENGIKFFNHLGQKLSSQDEKWIEGVIFTHLIHNYDLSNDRKGDVYKLGEDILRYMVFLKSTIGKVTLDNLVVCLDCANGSTSFFAKDLFTQLNAKVYPLHDTPSGEKINVGGAVAPNSLRDLVLAKEADVGFAFDGDGDRVIAIDEKGNILDGDYILAIVGINFLKNNSLPNNTIVGTVMSNLGLKIAIEKHGGRVILTKVGDKYVLEEIIKNGLKLGGEQSGHIVFLDYLPTPDGMLTALQILKVMKESGKPLSELASCMEKFPQILVNVRVKDKVPFSSIQGFEEVLSHYESKLGSNGRILVRYSGTEPLARIMVEGSQQREIEDIANSLAEFIKKEIGEEIN
ncbi:MAG: phosphoglucosamine mutase [Candidatus Omnitrophica bacterium]|nr:phosphoglucosamine mutase [Candidatus Omnitrophota bacterium]